MTRDPRALLVLAGRAELAFHELHGEPLYAHGLRALHDALGEVQVVVDAADADRVDDEARSWGVPATVLAMDSWWAAALADARSLLVHDALCPLVTPDFIGSVVARADERPGSGAAAVHAVTDTLKSVVDGRITGTIDRERLASVTSPVLVPAEVLARAPGPMPLDDAAALVTWLRRQVDVELVRAPALGRRIEHRRAVRLLESLDEVGHRVRAEAGHRPSVAEDRP